MSLSYIAILCPMPLLGHGQYCWYLFVKRIMNPYNVYLFCLGTYPGQNQLVNTLSVVTKLPIMADFENGRHQNWAGALG